MTVPIGYAVALPDVFADTPVLPAEVDESIVITGKELAYLEDIIPEVIERFRDPGRHMVRAGDTAAIRRALMPIFEYGTTLFDRIGSGERTIFSLTAEQCELLDLLREQKRALIKGCAGSGKTVMAVKKARELAAEGKKVLLICFNRVLGQRLKETAREMPGVTCDSYFRFCRSIIEEAGFKFAVPSDEPEFWTRVPDMVMEALQVVPRKYDAVIVDEGQDFIEQWVTIEEMLDRDGWFYIFYDPEQNLFGGEAHLSHLRPALRIDKELPKF